MKKLMCSLFGPPRIKSDGKTVNIKSRKGLAMLAYLASAGWAVEREVLASLLWPEYDNCRARANLRRTLFTVQQTPIAGWFNADQYSISLTARAMNQIDIARFDRHLAANSQESLRRAISLYKGDFLAGFYLPDCDAFEEWVIGERERYQRKMLDALDRLTLNYLTSGKYGAAVESARRQLALDNLREAAWRQLMVALAGSGRRAEALAEFYRCCQLLEDEVGVEPSGDTMALVASIQQIDDGPALEYAGGGYQGHMAI